MNRYESNFCGNIGVFSCEVCFINDSKIKQDTIQIGQNIRRIRKAAKIGQTELSIRLQLRGVDMTRESLVKIERGIQHIYTTQLRAIKEELNTTYDELMQ